MSRPPQRPEGRDDGGFLARWSRRKRRAQAEAQAAAQPPRADTPDSAGPPYHPIDADLPPLDALDEQSDYSGFLSPRVSEELRRLALRKLFHSPAYNVRDPLDIYADDYTAFAPLGDVVTADRRFQREVAARAQASRAAAATESPAARVDQDAVTIEAADAADHVQAIDPRARHGDA